MADLVIKDDIVTLAADLDALISEFEGASGLQDECKGRWGQNNANLSMGDFAHNWKERRANLVKKLQQLSKDVAGVGEGWRETDAELAKFADGPPA